ncbi:MAG: phosphoenolpyruvate synthase [Myxococcota bacterium]
MRRDVLSLEEAASSPVSLVGGKGAHLGALSRLDGIVVPPGVCVTTEVFRRALAHDPSLDERLDHLASLRPDAHDELRRHAVELRARIEALPFPAGFELTARLDPRRAYAVRSSATAEDLPTASFAGQHDTFLDVDAAAVLTHVRRCWASLFTERAISYRNHHRIDHRKVAMAVVVQEMLAPRASGVLFTADPLSGNRKVSAIEATPGVGEPLVAGRTTPDVFRVREGVIVERKVGARSTLTDAQVARLARLGRHVEAQLGSPQDLEWCLVGDDFQFVQSRPITTLFPIPSGDGSNHVYLSVGHQQMMTDALRPLGLSMFQLTALRPMHEAGGRLFVDVTQALSSPPARAALLSLLAKSDPLFRDAVQTALERVDFLRGHEAPATLAPGPETAPPAPQAVHELITETERSLARLEHELPSHTGVALFDFIVADAQELKRLLFERRSQQAILSAMEAAWWLHEHLETWLGEQNAADVLTQSVEHNVTSEMGLALLDVADAVRPHREVVSFLEQAKGDDFLDALPSVPGGREARAAIDAWLERYGMRCVGEIDLTMPRWRERPSTLLPVLLANVRNFVEGEAARRFARGRDAARAKEHELLTRLRTLPDGERKATETKERIARLRALIGFREFPKYGMICRYFLYKRALLTEVDGLVRGGVLGSREDAFFLRFDELREAVRTQRVDTELLRARRETHRWHQSLRPPRVLTSEGEVFHGAYQRTDVPPGALLGLAVSAGTVEGRARVMFDLAQARLEPGDILITPFTDPSWTPAFVMLGGLVTEVGGVMTHGAVIAREYGLPAVVGVTDATRLIRDGQRVRVDGTRGTVELLAPR